MNIRTSLLGPRLLAGVGLAALLCAAGLFASSRPARTAGGPIAVNVANAPLATTATDNKDKQAVQFYQSFSIAPEQTYTERAGVYTVPAGKRLIIESVTGSGYGLGIYDNYDVRYESAGGLGTEYGFGGFRIYTDTSSHSADTSYSHLYAEAGQEVFLQVFRKKAGSSGYVGCSFSGYLVDIATPGGSS